MGYLSALGPEASRAGGGVLEAGFIWQGLIIFYIVLNEYKLELYIHWKYRVNYYTDRLIGLSDSNIENYEISEITLQVEFITTKYV